MSDIHTSDPAGAERRSNRKRGLKTEVLLFLAAIATAALVNYPYWRDMRTVYRAWDSPSYLTIARTLYRVEPGNPLTDGVHPPFYLAHFPLYPLAIRAFAFIGYEFAVVFVSVIAGALASIVFYRLARDVWKLSSPGYLALVFLLLPPKWFLCRSIGGSESLYILMVLLSVLFMERGRLGRASLFAGLAALTRASGVLMPVSYAVVLWRRGAPRKAFAWLAAIPVGVAAYFLFCKVQFGSFFAPFEPNLDKISSLVPFASLPWLLGQHLFAHAEFHILLAILYGVGISRIREFPVIFWYSAVQYVFYLFISADDWSRYLLAMAPFALVVGYRGILESRIFRWFLLPASVPLSIIYARGVIPRNQCPPDLYERILAHLGLS